ncbi:secreted RxLR effector protein 78-like [Bidens hawaiensis]|uniref:secreted RxLR effector protein 78-like n=1 Tax=Bidens hawaiensis TaxID=980011 RepID=UPI0040493CBA
MSDLKSNSIPKWIYRNRPLGCGFSPEQEMMGLGTLSAIAPSRAYKIIDFEKAFDNVKWNFLMSIMEQMGFPDKWCKWILRILSSARSSVLVNGSPTFEFQCFKGLRQGDPISPFLFIIVMEAFSCMFRRAAEAGIFKGIQTPNGGPILSHLLYADDAMIMGEWSLANLKMWPGY